jgi:hypothetical protein
MKKLAAMRTDFLETSGGDVIKIPLQSRFMALK